MEQHPVCKLWPVCGLRKMSCLWPVFNQSQTVSVSLLWPFCVLLCPFCCRLWLFCVLLWPFYVPSVALLVPSVALLCPFCGRLWPFCVLLWPSGSPSVAGYDTTITSLWPYCGCLWPPHYVEFVMILSWICANSVVGLYYVYDPHLKVYMLLKYNNVVTQIRRFSVISKNWLHFS